ncbi:MAG: hypothetical protein M5U09_21990 [Gammaproteobacteria bacterium]|nr:hypothetical protein [Gammaproteobacteria bacterium]
MIVRARRRLAVWRHRPRARLGDRDGVEREVFGVLAFDDRPLGGRAEYAIMLPDSCGDSLRRVGVQRVEGRVRLVWTSEVTNA